MLRFNVLFSRNISPSEWRQRHTHTHIYIYIENYMHTSIQVNFTIIQASAVFQARFSGFAAVHVYDSVVVPVGHEERNPNFPSQIAYEPASSK